MGKTLKKLISDDIESFLNKSIQIELTNSHTYYGMYSWLADNGFNNGADLYKSYAQQETEHAEKLMSYLDDRNAKIIIPTIDKTKVEFKGVYEILVATFDKEVDTANNYNVLCTKCLREGDHTTYQLSQWYINEQVEEVVKARKLVDFANLLGETSPNLNYFIEKEFEELLPD